MKGKYTKKFEDKYNVIKLKTTGGFKAGNGEIKSAAILPVIEGKPGTIENYTNPDPVQLMERLRQDLIVGYGTGVEIRFLCNKAGIEDWDAEYVEVSKMIKKLLPKDHNLKKLSDYAEKLGLTAEDEAGQIYQLYEIIKKISKESNLEKTVLGTSRKESPYTAEDIKGMELELEKPALEPEPNEEDIEEYEPISEPYKATEEDIDTDTNIYTPQEESGTEAIYEPDARYENYDIMNESEIPDVYEDEEELDILEQEEEPKGYDIPKIDPNWTKQIVMTELHTIFINAENKLWPKWVAKAVNDAGENNFNEYLHYGVATLEGEYLKDFYLYTYKECGNGELPSEFEGIPIRIQIITRLLFMVMELEKGRLFEEMAKGMIDEFILSHKYPENDTAIEVLKSTLDYQWLQLLEPVIGKVEPTVIEAYPENDKIPEIFDNTETTAEDYQPISDYEPEEYEPIFDRPLPNIYDREPKIEEAPQGYEEAERVTAEDQREELVEEKPEPAEEIDKRAEDVAETIVETNFKEESVIETTTEESKPNFFTKPRVEINKTEPAEDIEENKPDEDFEVPAFENIFNSREPEPVLFENTEALQTVIDKANAEINLEDTQPQPQPQPYADDDFHEEDFIDENQPWTKFPTPVLTDETNILQEEKAEDPNYQLIDDQTESMSNKEVQPTKKPKKHKEKGKWGKILLGVLVFVLVMMLAVAGYGLYDLYNQNQTLKKDLLEAQEVNRESHNAELKNLNLLLDKKEAEITQYRDIEENINTAITTASKAKDYKKVVDLIDTYYGKNIPEDFQKGYANAKKQLHKSSN